MKYKLALLILVIGSVAVLTNKKPHALEAKTEIQKSKILKAQIEAAKEIEKAQQRLPGLDKKLLAEAQDLTVKLSSLRTKRQKLFKQIEFLKEADHDSSMQTILVEIEELDQKKIEMTKNLIEKYSTIAKTF